MSKRTQQQIEQLRSDLLRHNKLYYIDAQPEITDLEYDQLLKELHRLEQLYPEYDSSESPTKRVGEQPVDHLVTVDHRLPMLSIDNTYNPTNYENLVNVPRMHSTVESQNGLLN